MGFTFLMYAAMFSPVLSGRILWVFYFYFYKKNFESVAGSRGPSGTLRIYGFGRNGLGGDIAPPNRTLETPSPSASAPPLGSYLIAWGPDAGQAVNMSGKSSLGPSSFPGWPQRWLCACLGGSPSSPGSECLPFLGWHQELS